jgi:serine O-acetyltransferase
VLADLRRDLERYPRGGRGLLSTLGLLSTPQLQITLLHRLSHQLHVRGWRGAGAWLAWLNFYLHKAAISPASCIGGGLYLASPVGIVFHGRAGTGLSLYTRSVCFAGGAMLLGELELAPCLGDDVAISTHAAVQGPLVIGDRARIGFNVALRTAAPADRLAASKGMLARTRDGRS